MKNPELLENQVNTLCRTCLKHLVESNKYDIFLIPNLVKWLSVCTSLMIDENDGFPKNLCDICYQKIQEFYEFREKCLDSIKKFEEIRHNLITKSELNAELKCDPTENQGKQLKIENHEKYTKNDFTYSSDDYSCSEVEMKPNRIENISDIEEDDNDDYDDDDDNAYMQPEVKIDVSESSSEDEDRDDDDDDDNDNNTDNEKKIKKERNNGKSTRLSKKKCTRENFDCNVCNKKFFKKEMYDAHMRVHAGLQPWECSVCKKPYRQFNSLRDHMKYVHGPKDELETFRCTYEGCGRSYKYKETLKVHIKKAHTEKGKIKKSYMCEECGKSMSTLAGLKCHRLTHTGEFPFKCDICSKRFRIKYKLREHMKRHIGIKNFICSICGLKKFSQYELNVHMNFHTKEKLAKCKFCDYTSCNAANVIRHQTIRHCTIKLYECNYCEKSFRKPEQLQNHEVLHTGEKPHECHICGRRFSQRRLMRRHINRHTKNTTVTAATTAAVAFAAADAATTAAMTITESSAPTTTTTAITTTITDVNNQK